MASASSASDSGMLAAVAEQEGVDTLQLAQRWGVEHQAVVGIMKSLGSDGYINSEQASCAQVALTPAGHEALENGSPEARVFAGIPAEGASIADVQAAVGQALYKTGFGAALKAKWVTMDKAAGRLNRAVDSVEDTVPATLQAIKDGNTEETPELKAIVKRKFAKQSNIKYYKLSKGPEFALERKKPVAELTREMLESGEWETAKFKSLNFDSVGAEAGGGHLHVLLKVRAEFRAILLEMGFAEMPTARFVESSFWNFDALFQPQSHPARDAHDTFFVTRPAAAHSVPEAYLARVQDMHEHGGAGSIGYRYHWQRSEAMKNLLRTHTTAVSARMLHALANQPGGFRPARYFSVDRVFRNETLDATHLAEFHQVEGVVADYNLSLGDLLGVFTEFFRRIGITNLKFKPAYNPYTEPSMEIFGYHPDLKKWTEIGNSGIFRPEMLAPMGLPPGVRVIAWGLSLERPTMIKYRIKNIRDLFGHKVKLGLTRNAPIARFTVDDADAAAAAGADATPAATRAPAAPAAGGDAKPVPGGTATPALPMFVEGTGRTAGRFSRPLAPIV